MDISNTTEALTPTEPQWEALHPKARRLMQVGGALTALVPIVPMGILLSTWDSAGMGAKLALWGLALLAAAALGWLSGALRYARTQFALDAAGLRIRRGLIWRSETLVPRSRVQHTDINRGPLDRRFDLATLKVYTAGTKLASVSLDGLPQARAVEMRNALVTSDDDAV